MGWFSRVFNPVGHARQAQASRGTNTRTEVFRSSPEDPGFQLGIPVEWSRAPWEECIRYAPPEMKLVGNKYSAKIDILITDTGRPNPDRGFMPQGRVEDMRFAYEHLYEAFCCLDFQSVQVPGARAAARITFSYRSYGIDCIDSHTMAQCGHHNFVVMCSAVAKYHGVYEALYKAVLQSVEIRSAAGEAS